MLSSSLKTYVIILLFLVTEDDMIYFCHLQLSAFAKRFKLTVKLFPSIALTFSGVSVVMKNFLELGFYST